MTHWLLHRARVCCCRKQMILLLCKITSTHPGDSPARHQTRFTSVSKYIPITILISADYLFLPSTPSLNDDNMAVFSFGSRAGPEAAPAWLSSVCQKPFIYKCSRNAVLQGLSLHQMIEPFSLMEVSLFSWDFSCSVKISSINFYLKELVHLWINIR